MLGNYNIEDGLINSVDEAFKSYTNSIEGIDVVWIEVLDPDIGKLKRRKFHVLFDK